MDANLSKQRSESYIPSSETENGSDFKTISESLLHFSTIIPNKDAFVFVSADGDREAVTWKQLHDKSVSAARGFIQLGVKRHEFVALNVRTCPEWLYMNFGVILAGARVANISFTYTDGSDVKAMMVKLGTCSTMVLDAGVDQRNWSIFRTIIDEYGIDGSVKSATMPYLRYLVMLERPANTPNLKTVSNVMEEIPSHVELPVLNKDDVVSLFQTSGSTGVPKLVALTHVSLIATATAFTNINMSSSNVPSDNWIFFNDRPFTWLGGWPFTALTGMTRVTRSELGNDPEDNVAFTFDVIQRERCNFAGVLPPMLHAMMERQAELGNDWPLEYIFTGGQPITKDLAKCTESLCKEFICTYAGTEFGMVGAARATATDEFEEFSCGNPSSGVELRIVDENEEIVPVGIKGEIHVRSKKLFKEYWNDPQKTKSVLTPEGWYKTDDIGYMSKNGSLFVEGRKSDMIISGGMNVSPVILETAIKKCPDVDTVIVVPVSHPVLYQVVCACVIPMAGSSVTEEALRRHCEYIHNDKPGLFTILPKYYLIMEKFPKTKNGKTSRKDQLELPRSWLKDKYHKHQTQRTR